MNFQIEQLRFDCKDSELTPDTQDLIQEYYLLKTSTRTDEESYLQQPIGI